MQWINSSLPQFGVESEKMDKFDINALESTSASWLFLTKIDCNQQKQPFRGVRRKRCSENMQQMYRKKPSLLKSHFDMGVLLYICCMFSDHLFLKTSLDGYF